MSKHMTRIALPAILMFCFVSVMYAGPVNCSVTPSNVACAPTITLTYKVGSGSLQTFAFATPPIYAAGSWSASFTPQTFSNFTFTGGQLASSPDPYVGFSFGIVNTSKQAMTFNYDFTTPYAGGPYAFVSSVFGDVLIDTNFTGTSTVTPIGSNYIMNTFDSGNLLSQVNIGRGCTTPAHRFVCTSPDIGALGPLHYTSFASGTLEVEGSFTVTPGGQYTLTGRSSLAPIPEPGTMALFATGVIGLAGVLRRRINL
jgi:hypothetical protein